MFSTVTRRIATPITAVARRNMSGGHGNAAEEVSRWTKLTIVMVGLTSVFGVYNVMAHEHDHGRHGLPYQKLRNKPYPWTCSDCNLFDNACWAECRGEKTSAEH